LEKQRGERPAAGQGASTGSERNKQILNDIFRHAHSLKGAAQAVGLTDIANLGRSLEELLFQAKEGRTALTPSLFEKAFATLAATESAVLEIGHLPLSEEADVNEEISSRGSNG
jgi:chemotaxis protein histidine kinase CheA